MTQGPDSFNPGVARRLARQLHLTKITHEQAQLLFDASPTDLAPLPEDSVNDIVRFAAGTGTLPSRREADEGYWKAATPLDVQDECVVLNRNRATTNNAVNPILDKLRAEVLGVEAVPKSQLDEQSARNLIDRATEYAEEIVGTLGINEAPVDPFAIANSEKRHLVVRDGDFGELFDGQLEFHPRQEKFLLFVNSKYDKPSSTIHHPRTRFSIAHELAHYFLEDHHRYLRTGGSIHRSRNEFFSEQQREREADAFAAALLMPRRLFEQEVNRRVFDARRIFELSEKFQTSVLSTALRAVQLSHFPCAVAAIREGTLAWARCSESLIEAGCFPAKRGTVPSYEALEVWERFNRGQIGVVNFDGQIRDWFRTYDRHHLERLRVAQHFIGISSMGILLVLLTIEEEDIFQGDAEDGGDD